MKQVNQQFRYLDEGYTLGRYTFPALIKCPQCGQAGEVISRERFVCTHCNFTLVNQQTYVQGRLTGWSHWVGEMMLSAAQACHHCGTYVSVVDYYVDKSTQTMPNTLLAICPKCHFHNHLKPIAYPIRFPKTGRDVHFGLPLLLAIDSPMGRLWAYNHKHLLELKRFLQADLRERHALAGNGSMISRLPLWIKLGKNREELLKMVEKLEKIYQISHQV